MREEKLCSAMLRRAMQRHGANGSGGRGMSHPRRENKQATFTAFLPILCQKKVEAEMTGQIPDAGKPLTVPVPQSGLTPARQMQQVCQGHHADWPVHTQTGIVAGTRVLTADGLLPVELLGRGDRVITRNTGLVRLIAVEFAQCGGDFVQIAAGSLGDTRPETDTILAADQTVLLRGNDTRTGTTPSGRLVRAADLAAGEGCSLLAGVEFTVVRLIFHSPQLVYADGLETLCQTALRSSLAA
jgi:hypothetical protein